MGPLYFASGSSRPADIRGFAAIGHAVGVSAPEVSPNAERELARLAGTGLAVFVDSGAFSEVEFSAEGVRVVRPIDHAAWTARLALYGRLAAALGSQVHLVGGPAAFATTTRTVARSDAGRLCAFRVSRATVAARSTRTSTSRAVSRWVTLVTRETRETCARGRLD
jgi:hypothetical protein